MFKQLILLFSSLVILFVKGTFLYAYSGSTSCSTGTIILKPSASEVDQTQTFKLAPFSTYRMVDLIYVKLYHQVINNLEKNNIFVKQAYLDFAEELIPQFDLDFLESKGFIGSLEKMLETAKVLHAIKNGISNEWENVFKNMNIWDKNCLLLNLVYCFEELGDEEKVAKLINYMDNLDHDTTIRAPEYVSSSYDSITCQNWKDQALICLIRLYAAKNKFFSAEGYFRKIAHMKNRYICYREWMKNSNDLKIDGFDGMLSCFDRIFLYNVMHNEDPVNYFFWLPEAEVFYLFLEARVKDYNTIPIKDYLQNLRIPSYMYGDLDKVVAYQEVIKYILNKQYDQAEQMYFHSNGSFGIHDYDKLVRARLIEEYINRANEKLIDSDEEILPESLFNDSYGDFFDLKLLLMQIYCKHGLWGKALELLKEKSRDYPYGISNRQDNDCFTSNHYYIHLDVLKFMVYCMESNNYEEGL
ncbi:MAG: hypothetical protein HZB76_07530 [Chlamydiae bacterium]|nr:hypothetical protein [Chlamydiota bacterium]